VQGARPLKRAIQTRFENPPARKALRASSRAMTRSGWMPNTQAGVPEAVI